ncbi:hypothetical protein JCM21900_006455 [Sporobolomyces salmonicolor]
MGKKTPKTTPRTTAINPASVATVLTAFSPSTSSTASASQPSSLYYAHLHCAPDAHTLRVYEVDSGRCVSRWASNAAGSGGDAADDEQRVRSLEWCWLPAPGSSVDVDGAEATSSEGKRGKKRRKSDGGGAVDSPAKLSAASLAQQQPKLMLALGLESGAILIWDPRGTTARTLQHPTSNSPVTALASPVSPSAQDGHLWSAHQDGSIRVWDLASGTLVGKVSGLSEEKRWDDLLVRYEAAQGDKDKRAVQFVLSHLSLHAYSLQLAAPKEEGKPRDLKATEIGRCTGHVEPCSLRWTGISSSPSSADDADKLSFLSYSSTDRFVQIWSLPSTSSSPANGNLLARLALDSGVSSASISPLASSTAASQTLAAIDTLTGNVSLALLPLSFPSAAESSTPSKKNKKAGSSVVALEAVCEISAPAAGGKAEAGAAEAAFRGGEEGKVVLCRGGVKPVFEVVAFQADDGSFVKKVELVRAANGSLLVGSGAVESTGGTPQPTRYSEHSTASVAAASSAPDAVAAASDDDEAVNAGELDVDMAEPTLADRLKALNVSQKKDKRKAALAAKKHALAAAGEDIDVASESSGSELDDESNEDSDGGLAPAVPATTLTTTLVQALHSSDAPLLESCLAHSNPQLVRSTVKRLPSGGLVLSLLEALVERLGREKKGKEGMASVKRARALVAWLRETLIIHVGFLVTIPSLVNRLAALHASLTQRLALQPTLLALNGRLELVLSQIDMRQDRQRSAPSALIGGGRKKRSGGRKYVEGESTDEEEDEDEDGEIEDVVLGAAGGEESDEDGEGEFEDEDDEEPDSAFEDEEDGAGSNKPRRKVNGVSSLLDLEASEDEGFDEVDEEEFGGIDDDDASDDDEAAQDSE